MNQPIGSIFRPKTEPARTLYDAFQAESLKRPDRMLDVWIALEQYAVWNAAKAYALKHDMRTPTLAEVQIRKRAALGHVDYGAKWAIYVAEYMRKGEKNEPTNSYND